MQNQKEKKNKTPTALSIKWEEPLKLLSEIKQYTGFEYTNL